MLKVNKTKYGYFACDKPTYKKIRRLYYYYWQAVQQAANWNRWHAKNPNNRIIKVKEKIDGKIKVKLVLPKPEPELVPVFTKKEVVTSFYRKGVYVPGGFQEEKVSVCDMGILALYAAVKKPKNVAKNLHETTHTIEEIIGMLGEIASKKVKWPQ